MEFYEPQNIQLNGITPIDPDTSLSGATGPAVDRYGFVGEHKQASETTQKVPVNVLRQRELKWIEMLHNWDKWITKKFPKVKERSRKGIPPSVRGLAWQHLSGSINLAQQNKGVFDALQQKESPEWEKVIEKDLSRTFPFHELFSEKDGQGQKDLFSILKAYAVYDPETGYCQAMSPVVAVLLMHMTAEVSIQNRSVNPKPESKITQIITVKARILQEAFWCLVMICDKYIPGYYSPKLEAVQLDGAIFGGLLDKTAPHISKHMKVHSIDPLLYMTEWFMCLLARNLPFATVLRVWDMFFCEGIKVLFRTTLAIMKVTLTPRDLPKCQGLFETNERLKHLPMKLMQEDSLIPVSLNMKLSIKDLRKEHAHQLSKRPGAGPSVSRSR